MRSAASESTAAIIVALLMQLARDQAVLVRGYGFKIFYFVLRAFYGFDRWHADAPYYCRPYKSRVVRLASSTRPSTVLEVGCGLGEIVARIDAEQRYGCDMDAAVIRAARRLQGRNAQFFQASIEDAGAISRSVGARVDLLVAVNWCHTIPIERLAAAIGELARATSARALVIDSIYEHHREYAHHHSVTDLRRMGDVVESIDAGDGFRMLHVVQLRQAATPA